MVENFEIFATYFQTIILQDPMVHVSKNVFFSKSATCAQNGSFRVFLEKT